MTKTPSTNENYLLTEREENRTPIKKTLSLQSSVTSYYFIVF